MQLPPTTPQPLPSHPPLQAHRGVARRGAPPAGAAARAHRVPKDPGVRERHRRHLRWAIAGGSGGRGAAPGRRLATPPTMPQRRGALLLSRTSAPQRPAPRRASAPGAPSRPRQARSRAPARCARRCARPICPGARSTSSWRRTCSTTSSEEAGAAWGPAGGAGTYDVSCLYRLCAMRARLRRTHGMQCHIDAGRISPPPTFLRVRMTSLGRSAAQRARRRAPPAA
jgi:hypothetical protein